MPGLPAGDYNPFRISYRDAGNRKAAFSGYGKLITALNFAAQQTLFTTLVDAADELVLGAKVSQDYGGEVKFVTTQPTNGASVSTALLVQWQDSAGARGTAKLATLNDTIPTYVININVRDGIELDAPSAVSDFVAAFGAFAINPVSGLAALVVGLKVTRGSR